ncbi:MAG: hypothetical protein IPP97_08975 [Candidatus Obscuribacter sp.]|nr:hypothetical protein [Candidatus Obscuribacter sp.]MBP6349460.1 hypothetical protein [Candidatus Obscuribacter sp.]MBP6593337.1 hypothetical protein [Candidatus Obscuribacter sp.]MBP7579281.1 hypothetical protein [Candidatus Obscuribacter sp.]
MNVFNYLTEDTAHISQMLNETVANFLDWPRDRVFEQTKKALSSLDAHFDKEKLLVNNLEGTEADLSDLVKTFQAKIKEIKEDMNSLIMIHVDEPGFSQVLQRIAAKVKDFSDFNANSFYPSLKDKLTMDEFHKIESQFETAVLS